MFSCVKTTLLDKRITLVKARTSLIHYNSLILISDTNDELKQEIHNGRVRHRDSKGASSYGGHPEKYF